MQLSVRIGRDALDLLRRKSVLLVMLFAPPRTWSSIWQTVFLAYYFRDVSNFGVLSAAQLSSIVPVSGHVGKLTLAGAFDFAPRNRTLAAISAALLLSYVAFSYLEPPARRPGRDIDGLLRVGHIPDIARWPASRR